MNFVILFYALIYLCISVQSEAIGGSKSKQCYKAKTCVHNNHEKCGISSNGTPRRFLDLCDIFEYNCLKNTDFVKSKMEKCSHLESLYKYEKKTLHLVYESDQDSNEVYANDFQTDPDASISSFYGYNFEPHYDYNNHKGNGGGGYNSYGGGGGGGYNNYGGRGAYGNNGGKHGGNYAYYKDVEYVDYGGVGGGGGNNGGKHGGNYKHYRDVDYVNYGGIGGGGGNNGGKHGGNYKQYRDVDYVNYGGVGGGGGNNGGKHGGNYAYYGGAGGGNNGGGGKGGRGNGDNGGNSGDYRDPTGTSGTGAVKGGESDGETYDYKGFESIEIDT